MRKLLTTFALAALLLGAAGVASAQETPAPPATGGEAKTGEAKTKFYNFDDMLIDGEIKKPSGLLTNSRDQVKFQRVAIVGVPRLVRRDAVEA